MQNQGPIRPSFVLDEEDKHVESADLVKETAVSTICMYLPIDYFGGNMEGLKDTKEFPAIYKKHSHILYILAHLIQNPLYSTDSTFVADPDENTPQNENTHKDERSLYYVVDDVEVDEVMVHGGSFDRVKTYIEVCYDNSLITVVGFRFWIFIQDPTLNFNYGITRLIQANSKKVSSYNQRHAEPIAPWNVWGAIKDKGTWINQFMSTYKMHRAMVNNKLCKTQELRLEENIANLYRVYNINDAFTDPAICDRQRTLTNYVGVPGQFITFPVVPNTHNHRTDVYHIPIEQFSPEMLHYGLFPHIFYQREDFVTRLPADAQGTEEMLLQHWAVRNAIKNATCEGTTNDEFVHSGKRLRKELERLYKTENVAMEDRAERKRKYFNDTPAVFAGFKTRWRSTGRTSPYIQKIIKWGEDFFNKSVDEGEYCSMVEEQTVVDSSLSPLANFIINCFNGYERAFDTHHMHSHIFLRWTCTLSVARSDLKMKQNTIFSGGAATGKSHVDWIIQNFLLVPGSYMTITSSSAQALKTTMDINNTTLWYDEAPHMLLGITVDGQDSGSTGDSELKMRITSGLLAVFTYKMDNGSKRETDMLILQQIVAYCINANAMMSQLPKPIRSRFIIVNCVDVKRPGHSIPQMDRSSNMFGGSEEKKKLMEIEAARHQKVQFFVYLIERCIAEGIIDEPTLTVGNTAIIEIMDFLERSGFDTSALRDYHKIMNQMRTLTIINAIVICFFTTLVFPVGKRFELKDILEVERYMFCTEEIAILAFTQLSCLYIDPTESDIIKCLARAGASYEYNHPTLLGKFRCDNNKTNFNYLIVSVDCCPKRVSDLLTQVGKLIMNGGHGGKFTTSAEGVADVLMNLSNRNLNVQAYNHMGQLSGEYQTMRIVEYNLTTKCVYILRQFVDKTYGPEYNDIVLTAARAIQHRYTRPKRVLTLLTYWDDPLQKIIAPHILKVLELVRDPLNTIYISKVHEDEVAETVHGGDGIYTVMNDLEECDFPRHLNRLGYPILTTNAVDPNNHALPRNCEYLYSKRTRNPRTYPIDVRSRYVSRERQFINRNPDVNVNVEDTSLRKGLKRTFQSLEELENNILF